MPGEVVALARRYMDKPTTLRAGRRGDAHRAADAQYLFPATAWTSRRPRPHPAGRDGELALVFCRTKRMADILAEELRERDVKASPIHSDLRQEARERALDRFRKGKIDVLVATEVAARGLDIDSVTHVVNYDCPDDEKMYLHRIGRTGRAGAAGVAVTLRRLGRHDSLEGHQQRPGPAVPGAAGDLLDLRAHLPRPRHPARHQGPARRSRAPSERSPGQGQERQPV